MPRQRNENRIVKEPSCWGRRTLLERLLCVLLFLAAIAILALAISVYVLNIYSEKNYQALARADALRAARSLEVPVESVRTVLASEPPKQETYQSYVAKKCEEPSYVRAAVGMMDKMDESIDPCDNFYQFACGKYLQNTILPADKVIVDSFSTVRDLVQEQLRTIINEEVQANESKPFRLAKNFNQACLNLSIIAERGEKPLADILESYGGWPVVKGDSWSEANWNWIETIKKFRLSGLDIHIIFSFSVTTDYKNSSRRIIDIDQTNLELPRDFLVKGLDEKYVKSYFKFMVDNAVIFGANREEAEKELMESLELEFKLANITLRNEDRRNATALYNLMTIKELQEKYPYLNWLDYINAMLPNGLQVDENEVINNAVPTFFEKLGDVLNSTSNRAMANYFLWRVVLTTSGTLTQQLRDSKLDFYKAVYGLQSQEERWKECITYTSVSLPISVGALYVRKYFPEESRQSAIELVDNIRDEFINILHHVPWMDLETREQAIKKAKAITQHIGYPNELAENDKLEEYYDQLEMENDNLLLNTLRLTKFKTDYSFNELRKPVNKTDWITHSKPSIVNALYSSLENSIQFPAAILQSAFFGNDRPRYMNYAAIGQIIGHEITHGFDDRGRQFDLDGNLFEWWTNSSREQFLEKANCIIEQYGNYTDLKTNLSLNGINTQGENVADNGGAKEAYLAYNNWVKRNQPECILPGLKYNQQQLFWISFGQTWCAVESAESLKSRIVSQQHAPNEFRVNGVLHNMREFSFDFNCPEGTKMNPAHKCQVW